MKTFRRVVYQKTFVSSAVYGKPIMTMPLKVEVIFSLKKGLRFVTILPNEAYFDWNPIAVIFRVLKFNKRFHFISDKLKQSMHRLTSSFRTLGGSSNHCAKAMNKLFQH
jgi:hypothetical protein